MIICVTGTPGTGKTTVAKILQKMLDFEYIDVMKLIKKNKLYDYFDTKTKSYIVDVDKVVPALTKELKSVKNAIVDSHLSHYLPKKCVDLCIVTKCELKELKKRLQKRKYSPEKVRENLDAEIFGVCLYEAKEKNLNTFVLYTGKNIQRDALQELIVKIRGLQRA